MLTGAELNYDTHDKELLAVFKVFKTWQHYLESPHHTIDVITDHKNLEYFSTTKTLSRQQAHWSEYLSAFIMVICFRPGKLGEKLDSLTHHVDFYLKRGDRDYMLANPQNLHPIFMQEQLATLLCTTHLQEFIADAATLIDTSIPILDVSALLEDIKAGYAVDPLASRELGLCLQGSPSLVTPSLPWVYSCWTATYMSRTTNPSEDPSALTFSSQNMTTQQLAILAITRHWNSFNAITYGPTYIWFARNTCLNVSYALATSPCNIAHTASCSHCRSPNGHGIQLVWILSNSCHHRTASPQSWWL